MLKTAAILGILFGLALCGLAWGFANAMAGLY